MKGKISINLIINLSIFVIFTPLIYGKINQEKEWAYFHGPNGNNISKETGLLTKWPEQGPVRLWTTSGLGKGYSSVVISNQKVFTAGSLEKQTYVFAIDYQGKILWKKPNGKRWEAGNQQWARDYDGARATPTVNEGFVYHLGELGSLSVFKATDGSLVWHKNIVEAFDGTIPRYGYAESLLIDGNNLICFPGGAMGYMVALDKKSGKTVWANQDVGEEPGYNSPILVEDQGLRQIITMTDLGVIGVNADSGELLWKIGHTNKRKLNIANPIYMNGHVCISSGYGAGTILVKLTYKGKKVSAEKVWFNELLDNHHGGILYLDDHIYGTGHEKKGWYCLDFKTGKTLFRDAEGGKGSFMYADGMFYYFTERGQVNLVKSSNESFKIVSSFQLPNMSTGFRWAHPVVCDGRLYLRHDDNLFVYKLSQSE
jgi:outer membrane protein assembly factor BamB